MSDLINGKIEVRNMGNLSKFLYAYDEVNNILHVRDKGEHEGMSLINSIGKDLRHKLVSKIEKEERISVETESLRCFIYTDGDRESFGNEIDEFNFKTSKFSPLKKADRDLKYWYKNNQIRNKPIPDFLK